jgi:outer membrane protein OmpA-like peptidoglycan-associated protein
MPIKSRPLGLVLMTLALLLSGYATMPQNQGVETVEETSRAIPEPQIATTENEALAVRETLAISPAEIVLQEQELYFRHDDSDTQRDTLGHLHLLVNRDRLGLVLGKGQLKLKSTISLRYLANVRMGYPESRPPISGGTDPIGSEQMNLRLSQERAQAVQGALLLDGVRRRTIAAAIGYMLVQWHETCDQRQPRHDGFHLECVT